MIELTNAEDIIEALGGTRAVADLTGRKYNAAYQWYRLEHFPSDTFVVMTAALERRGYTAPFSLWKMMEPAR